MIWLRVSCGNYVRWGSRGKFLCIPTPEYIGTCSLIFIRSSQMLFKKKINPKIIAPIKILNDGPYRTVPLFKIGASKAHLQVRTSLCIWHVAGGSQCSSSSGVDHSVHSWFMSKRRNQGRNSDTVMCCLVFSVAQLNLLPHRGDPTHTVTAIR